MLPRLILIADRFTDNEVAAKLPETVAAGVEWIHLRDHAASEDSFLTSARHLKSQLLGLHKDLRLSINSRQHVAIELGLNYHMGQRGTSPKLLAASLAGYSAHTVEEGKQRVEEGCDYLFFSPIFPTSSKPGHKGVGMEALSLFCQAVAPVPVYALGGISPERCDACLNAGAYGVAVISGILNAPSLSDAVKAYLQSLSISKYTNKC